MGVDRMKGRAGLAVAAAALAAAAWAAHGCYESAEVDVDGSADSDSDADGDSDEVPSEPLDGVDVLVIIDNSGSMAEEQALLATGLFELVDALAAPLPGWPFGAIDSMHLAVVTSDLGVSYGEDAEIPGDSITPPSLSSYLDRGDDGVFQGILFPEVALPDGEIPCDESGAQCPASWWCDDVADDGIGVCAAPDGAIGVACPELDGAYAQTPDGDGDPNGSLNLQAACLAQQGTGGCGFEQQLASAARALGRDDQQSFLEDGHLLVVLLITDEEDCSMADAPGLFATPECLDATRLNIACNTGDNEQYLFDAAHFHDAFVDAKGDAASVLFAAIAGVPYGGDDGADACQGRGDGLGECLDAAAMEMVSYVDGSSGQDIYKFVPACTRTAGGTTVTSAVPGRRYVALAADEFGSNGYVYSICNADWNPAFEDLAEMIAEKIAQSHAP